MGNDIRREQNNGIRKIRTTLDTLNQLVKTKEEIVEKTPEFGFVDKFSAQSDVAVVEEDEQFAELCEQVAGLQFSGEEKNNICKTLAIPATEYKRVVMSNEFADVKRRIAEDQKMNILAKVLKQVDAAVKALEDLAACADDDKTRLNAAALVLETATRLLEEQKFTTVTPNGFDGAMNNAAAGALAGGGTVTLQQMIIAQRASRGLSG
jgi:hypothetical protein